MRSILITLFLVFSFTFAKGQSNNLGKLSLDLTERYRKGFDIVDCVERRDYWLSMYDYMEEIDLNSTLLTTLYFHGNSMSLDRLHLVNDLMEDTTRKIEILGYCSDNDYSSGICEMCTDVWGGIIENYINQIYIYYNYLESGDKKIKLL